MRANVSSRSAWVEKAARAGYAAKGVIYALVGGLAIASVVGASGSGQVGGGREAVQTIGQQSYGQILLVLIGVGLLGYAAWRFIQAYYDPENVAAEKGGTLKRIGYVASGVVHTALAVAALQMAIGSGSSSGSEDTYLAKLIGVDTIGPILAVAAGLFILGFAAYELYKGVTASFVDELKMGQMPHEARSWVVRIGRVGLIARGIVFILIGIGVTKAGLSASPSQTNSVGEALHEIGSETYGAILLVLVAGGLAAYGAYQVVLAKYRRIPA